MPDDTGDDQTGANTTKDDTGHLWDHCTNDDGETNLGENTPILSENESGEQEIRPPVTFFEDGLKFLCQQSPRPVLPSVTRESASLKRSLDPSAHAPNPKRQRTHGNAANLSPRQVFDDYCVWELASEVSPTFLESRVFAVVTQKKPNASSSVDVPFGRFSLRILGTSLEVVPDWKESMVAVAFARHSAWGPTCLFVGGSTKPICSVTFPERRLRDLLSEYEQGDDVASSDSVLASLLLCYEKGFCAMRASMALDTSDVTSGKAIILNVDVYLTTLGILESVDAVGRRTNGCMEIYILNLALHPPVNETADPLMLTSLIPETYPVSDRCSSLQPVLLSPRLLPYQRRAVGWMLYREGVTFDGSNDLVTRSEDVLDQIPMLYDHFWADPAMNSGIYVHRLSGAVSLTLPTDKDNERLVRGGILSEEMGLGKTIELLALILLHQQSISPLRQRPSACMICGEVWDGHNEEWKQCNTCDAWAEVDCLTPGDLSDFECDSCWDARQTETEDRRQKSPGTLIIAPTSIIEQWVSEIQTHAPSLSLVVYTTLAKPPLTVRDLRKYDIVIASYDTLRKEVHAARAPPTRSRRSERAYERRRSPLNQIQFWRVVLDEAQMVESSVSQAAAMAKMIPRVNAWAVTGTPVGRHGLDDLFGLIQFLNIQPLVSFPALWRRLQLPIHRSLMTPMLRRFMHRNTKENVKAELTLPNQSERTLSLSFSKVERTWYDQLFQDMLAHCNTIRDDVKSSEADMASWLLQLRQTCCHPQVGTHNRKTFGGTLRSIDEVLDLMLRSAIATAAAAERHWMTTRIWKAQLAEFVARDGGWRNATVPLRIYASLLEDVRKAIADLERQSVNTVPMSSSHVARPALEGDGFVVSDNDSEADEGRKTLSSIKGQSTSVTDPADAQNSLPQRLYLLREIEHRVVFFMASIHFSLKNKEEETALYNAATELRAKLLAPSLQMADRQIALLSTKASQTTRKIRKCDVIIEEYLPPLENGLVGRLVLEMRDVAMRLDGQWKEIKEWREKMIHYATQPLADDRAEEPEETATDANNEEGSEDEEKSNEYYLRTLDSQNFLDAYHHRYKSMLADRNQLLTGQRYEEGRHEILTMTKPEREFRQQLDATRKKFILRPDKRPMKEILAELIKAQGKPLPAIEKGLIRDMVDRLPVLMNAQMEGLERLQKEQLVINKVYNQRLLYFQNLQSVSDGVRKPRRPRARGKSDEQAFDEETQRTIDTEQQAQTDLVRLVSHVRYLKNVRSEENQGSSDEAGARASAEPAAKEWECLICKSSVAEGVVTPCGHVYHAECASTWIDRHHKCPLCNQRVRANTCTPFSIAPVPQQVSPPPVPISDADHDLNGTLLGHLAHFLVRGSYGTKLDALVRHVSYIRATDPTAKCLVFSQWENVLEILAVAFDNNGIGYVKMGGGSSSAVAKGKQGKRGRRDAAKVFKEDAECVVFMLNAKRQSAGLTLVSANHCFLVEPVVNVALEQQAINRIHRIGQHRETTVWRYLIRDTIEERVSVLGRRSATRGTSNAAASVNNPRTVERANRKGGGGEAVAGSDVRWCLFGDQQEVDEQEPVESNIDVDETADDPRELPAPEEDDGITIVESDSNVRNGPELDDSATTLLADMERAMERDLDLDDEQSGETGPPRLPAYTGRTGRGMAGRMRWF
ncbi:hypothetical protein HKX48_002198 [Thoreauomyces humboldtii]|nr:hypothetical protein HKX48_002198 [Thoreauomyces humboldtii]